MRGLFEGIRAKIGSFSRDFWDDVFLVVAIFLIALAAFGLGRLSVLYGGRQGGVEIFYPEGQEAAAVLSTDNSLLNTPAGSEASGRYVASISGSKYHLPHCSGARNIKEANKIYFATKAEAEIAGYTPAANCPGI